MARSPDSSGVAWLRSELPRLVERGVITPDAAEALDRHYPAEVKAEPSRFGFVISAILGSALLGAGIILLVAHNWDDLSRPIRSVISFVPLLATQALAFFVLVRRNKSRAWRESVAIFNIAAIGTAISLVAQTYQIQGDFARFILVWMFLALPVVYLLRTTAGLCAYLIGAMVWVISKSDYGTNQSGLWVWVLLAVAGPMLLALIRRNRDGFDALIGALIFTAATAVALGYADDMGIHRFWGCAFAGFWAVVYLVGSDWLGEWRSRFAHPFVPIAWIAIVSLVIVFSFKSGWQPSWANHQDGKKVVTLAVLIQVAWIIAGCLLGLLSLRREKQAEINLAPVLMTPIAVIAWFIFDQTDNPLIPSLIVNLFGLALGVFTLLRGVRAGRPFEANFGMLIVAALAIARFFDSEFEFIARGVGFILIGAGFLITNMILFRRRTHS